MSPIKATLVCQWYPPEPAPQPAWIAEGLAMAGLDVEVLTGIPNYPSGEVIDGYSAMRPASETINGVRVRRTPLYPSHDARPVRRVCNYVSWAISSAVLGQRQLHRSDVVLVYSSPATAALPAMVAKGLWGTPYVLLVQDVWPDSIFASGFLTGRAGRLARRMIERFVRSSFARADHVAVISPGMADLLAERGVPPAKCSVVYNWIDDNDGDVGDQSPQGLRLTLGLSAEDFLVMYAGNHGKAQALEYAVDAFARISPAARCHLVLVGDGVERGALAARARDNPNVHLLGPQPRVTMPGLMAAADAQLVSLADRPLFAVTMPSKVQSIMAAGLPLVVAARGDVADVVRRASAGVVSEPENAEALATVIEDMARLPRAEVREMGRRARAYYEGAMSARVGIAALSALLVRAAERNERVLDGAPRTRAESKGGAK